MAKSKCIAVLFTAVITALFMCLCITVYINPVQKIQDIDIKIQSEKATDIQKIMPLFFKKAINENRPYGFSIIKLKDNTNPFIKTDAKNNYEKNACLKSIEYLDTKQPNCDGQNRCIALFTGNDFLISGDIYQGFEIARDCYTKGFNERNRARIANNKSLIICPKSQHVQFALAFTGLLPQSRIRPDTRMSAERILRFLAAEAEKPPESPSFS